MISDVELIEQIKKDNDSSAVTELINRHTGIYQTMINRYSGFSDQIMTNDIKDDKDLNIYNWALTYDPARKMKFGTYVGNMTKFMCKTAVSKVISKKASGTRLNDYMLDFSNPDNSRGAAVVSELKALVKKQEDKRFFEIFTLRVEQNSTWREIGQVIGVSHETVRKIYNKNIQEVREILET